MLMQVTQTLPAGVQILMQRHRIHDPHLLAQTLNPRRRKRDVFKRVLNLYRSRADRHDPMKASIGRSCSRTGTE